MQPEGQQPGKTRRPDGLFELADESTSLWTPEELGALLRHQLAAPLDFDLGWLGADAGRLPTELLPHPPGIRTFGDLFGHPCPPVELLELTKEFAKAWRSRADAPLPEEIATVVYCLALVVAMTRCGRRITRLDDAALRHTLGWALEQPWLDATTRAALQGGLDALAVPTTPWPARAEPTLPLALPAPPGEDALDRGPAPHAPEMSSSARPALGRLGEYQLLRRLGEGGMGEVFQALHTEMQRVVAIKLLKPGLLGDESAVARFRREIRVAGRLDHPNVVRALDARQTQDRYFLVMEFVDGLDLGALAARHGPLKPADACEIARQAAVGLAHAHGLGLVHRDLKPSNLMLARDGRVKILDLGLTRFCQSGPGLSMTASGQWMGTPDYMAPEQFSDSRSVDSRADLYSLGCTLYHLLAGRPPFFDATSLGGKIAAHTGLRVPPLTRLRDDVPAALETAVQKLMAKAPEDRYPSSADAAQALAPLAKGSDLRGLLARTEERSTVRAADPTPRVPTPGPLPQATGTGPPRRRRRRVVLATAASTIAVVSVLAALLWNRSTGRDSTSGTSQPQSPTESSPLPTPPLPSGAPAPEGWIVMSRSDLLGRPGLWLFSPDGRRRIQITNDLRAYDLHPCFSPDGRRIAFARGRDPSGPDAIWVCDANGANARVLATAREPAERLASPVWVSTTRVYYTCDPRPDRAPDMEIWQVDLDGPAPRIAFRLATAVGKGAGLVTTASPDGRQLGLVAQRPGVWATADVYVTDVSGRLLHTPWSDPDGDHKDARALWSHDGSLIAWQHEFTPAGASGQKRYGLGMAERGPDGRWTPRLQSETAATVTPLAWSPRGNQLLCASLEEGESLTGKASLVLIDVHFQVVRELFELDMAPPRTGQADLGRLADWAVIPPDVPLRGR